LGAILIPEYLDFHSGYSAPSIRIAGRARIMTSLFCCNQRWCHVQVKVLRLLREERASGGAERIAVNFPIQEA